MGANTADGIQTFVLLRVLGSCVFPLPPLAEQHRIAAKVDQLMVLVNQMETQLAYSCATTNNILEALVAELANRK